MSDPDNKPAACRLCHLPSRSARNHCPAGVQSPPLRFLPSAPSPLTGPKPFFGPGTDTPAKTIGVVSLGKVCMDVVYVLACGFLAGSARERVRGSL